MGLIKTTIKRIIPITLLICFITYGLNFLLTGNLLNITYLAQSEKQYLGESYYYFDIQNYLKNLTFHPNVFNPFDASIIIEPTASNNFIQQFTINLQSFWQNVQNITQVQQPQDWILNGLILVLNFFITIINLLILTPLSLIFSILDITLSLIGFNTLTDYWLFTMIKFIETSLRIPQIPLLIS